MARFKRRALTIFGVFKMSRQAFSGCVLAVAKIGKKFNIYK